jgi:hypothetical protein
MFIFSRDIYNIIIMSLFSDSLFLNVFEMVNFTSSLNRYKHFYHLKSRNTSSCILHQKSTKIQPVQLFYTMFCWSKLCPKFCLTEVHKFYFRKINSPIFDLLINYEKYREIAKIEFPDWQSGELHRQLWRHVIEELVSPAYY